MSKIILNLFQQKETDPINETIFNKVNKTLISLSSPTKTSPENISLNEKNEKQEQTKEKEQKQEHKHINENENENEKKNENENRNEQKQNKLQLQQQQQQLKENIENKEKKKQELIIKQQQQQQQQQKKQQKKQTQQSYDLYDIFHDPDIIVKNNNDSLSALTDKKREKLHEIPEESVIDNKQDYLQIQQLNQRNIFVGNLDLSIVEKDLIEFFKSAGEINRATIRRNLEGKSKGFGFVEFLEHGGYLKSFQFNGKLLKGRPLKISKKRTNLPGFNNNYYSQGYDDYYHYDNYYGGGGHWQYSSRGGYGSGRGFKKQYYSQNKHGYQRGRGRGYHMI
ncbi:eukaryotic translation initiation factor 4b/4h [Anaeramoeba flamelloides]|uniref:Eukaryotic translation initiation factor 4b/4h n=1 Tax=Anaeramoeba flamelloides TaxID=1746091 RepID=A0AAV7YBW7_9EUKA|nr:eukaryotic translation initiation factor 4b/4h [Anaeramoeba flamelloides]